MAWFSSIPLLTVSTLPPITWWCFSKQTIWWGINNFSIVKQSCQANTVWHRRTCFCSMSGYIWYTWGYCDHTTRIKIEFLHKQDWKWRWDECWSKRYIQGTFGASIRQAIDLSGFLFPQWLKQDQKVTLLHRDVYRRGYLSIGKDNLIRAFLNSRYWLARFPPSMAIFFQS